MTAEAPSRPQPLYRSHRGLLEFQQDGVVHALLGPTLAVWDTGTGKSHLDMATCALMVERVADGDTAAHRIAGEDEGVQPELGCDRLDHLGIGLGTVVAARVGAGQAMRGLVVADHAILAAEPPDPGLPSVERGVRAVATIAGRQRLSRGLLSMRGRVGGVGPTAQ